MDEGTYIINKSKNMRIKVDLNKCVECYLCQLLCSLAYQGVCNPERSRVYISRREIGFSDECINECSLCIQHCLTDAMSVWKED